MRLIDADALEEVVYDDLHYRAEIENEDFDLVINYLEAAPTIDPESLRPLGVWVGEADGYADGDLFTMCGIARIAIIALTMAQMTPHYCRTTAPTAALL